MILKGITDECFSDFKVPSLFIAFPRCSFKCDRENGNNICQNSYLVSEPNINISEEELISRYVKNPITKAIVCGGLEPFDSEMDLLSLVKCIRDKFKLNDTIVIYTGYTEQELENGDFGSSKEHDYMRNEVWRNLKKYENIIIKYGRFRPNKSSHFDEVLGVELQSPNQYAKYIK